MKTLRPLLVVAAVAAALTLTGCATPIAGGSGAAPSPTETEDVAIEAPQVEASWAPGGSGILISTWGSGSCVPVVAGVETLADGLSVTFVEPDANAVCTMDYRERLSYAPVGPETDRTAPVALATSIDGADVTVEVAPFTGTVSDVLPAVGFTPAGAIAIVSEGSGSCKPVVSEISDETATTLTVTFAPAEGACTRDLVRRATLISSATFTGGDVTLVGLEGAAAPVTIAVAR